MSFINYSSREINCKIVYYGPGLGGKTTNLIYIYKKTSPDSKGKMISLATISFTIQYNKRDLPNVVPIEEMNRVLNPKGVPHFEGVATIGKGVFENLKEVAKQVILEIKKGAS